MLRIEDTDEKRSTQTSIDAILDGLKWLEIEYDGDYVLQSKNYIRHQQVANLLLETGKAYHCYTSAAELEEMRSAAEKQGAIFRFQSPWRNKTLSQTSTVKPVIRIKAPLEGETVIQDLVQGKVTVKNSELDDLVILRGDLTPTYMFAVVVDDHDMEVTHIIRGDDHLTNAFRQKIIYHALNWAVPEFAHIPLIHSMEGAKLSKRHGATSVIEYQAMGYLPEAMRNYLLRLGWAHGNEEIISDEDAIKWFDIKKVGRSPARFDFAKLNHLNHHYIKNKSDVELLALLKNCASVKKYFADNSIVLHESQHGKMLQATTLLKPHFNNLNELAAAWLVYLDGFNADLNEEAKKVLAEKKSLLSELKSALLKLSDSEWQHDPIKLAIDEFTKSKSLKIKDVGPALRLALTYSSNSAGGIFDVIKVVGRGEFERRITSAVG